jgi:hypothetical protein
MTAFATYWSSGGDIVAARGHTLSEDDARALRDLYLDEARAAAASCDAKGLEVARQLAFELSRALARSRRWRRAGRPVNAELLRPIRPVRTRP